ncbi:hypothetical protein LEMLEM_LOCUS5507 [Lemmus lemmus]
MRRLPILSPPPPKSRDCRRSPLCPEYVVLTSCMLGKHSTNYAIAPAWFKLFGASSSDLPGVSVCQLERYLKSRKMGTPAQLPQLCTCQHMTLDNSPSSLSLNFLLYKMGFSIPAYFILLMPKLWEFTYNVGTLQTATNLEAILLCLQKV